ncbi:MAG TPA: Gfo/Idh/MocA family oxidoreductase [Pyrinomonadaceae bacterium]|jgi:predicted dehydrogenase
MTKDETIGVGIIGTGFARTTQLPAFKAVGARVVAIASGRRANAERVARAFDIPFAADDWRAVVAHPDVALVSIVTPPATHREITLAALDAGKAVLCEKPMALAAAETEEMRRRADAAHALALVDHELRMLAGRRRLRELLRAGEIGRVRHVRYTFRTDARASAARAWNWWSDERMGGGTLGAIGSHAVDSCRWLLGAEVAAVAAQLTTHVRERADEAGTPRAVTTDDEASLLLRFTGGPLTAGTTGSVALSMIAAGAPEHTCELFGERGALKITEPEELYRASVGDGAWRRVEVEPTPLAPGLRDGSWARGFTVLARELIAALRAGHNTVAEAATFADGHRVQLVLDAARRAHESGRRIELE